MILLHFEKYSGKSFLNQLLILQFEVITQKTDINKR